MSDDGSYVYLRSTRVLVPGHGTEGLSNLYLWHGGALRFITTDNPAPPSVFDANQNVARSTPDGRHLLFVSSNPLTGYDNLDAMTGQPDSEVFLYDADADKLSCVSCRASGRRPTGKATLPLPPARPQSNLQRGVTDDGRRVFFDTTDALVPSDTNGKNDVYEYEDGAVHLISSGSSSEDSFFESASKSGDDVFFITREQLVADDDDRNADLYDARVGGGFAESVPGQPCSGDSCQGAPSPGQAAPAVASSKVTSDGDEPPAASVRRSFRISALSASARRRAARSGVLTLAVRVSDGGILKARAVRQSGRRATTVASASAFPPRAGVASVRMRLAASVRSALRHGTKVRLKVRVTFSRVSHAQNLTLELKR